MSKKSVTLDVRDEIRQGREPFSKIMGAADQLKQGQTLILLAPFEPLPLIQILSAQGFQHQTKPLADGDFEVRFVQPSDEDREVPDAESEPGAAPPAIIPVDARGLEPPQPLVTILEALAQLPPNAELHARTDRRPMHLYAQLEQRGFSGTSEVQSDGSYLTTIRRG